MDSRWEYAGIVLTGLAAVIAAGAKGLPPILRFLAARGREATEQRKLALQAETERMAKVAAREDRVLAALETSSAAIARSSMVSERVLQALVDQGAALERLAEGFVHTGEAVRVLLEDQRRYCRTGKTPLDSDEVPVVDATTIRVGDG